MKKAIILIILLVLTYNCYPQGKLEEHIYSLNNFSGGLTTHMSIYNVPKTNALVANNIRFNNPACAKSFAKRQYMRKKGSLGNYAVTGLYRYYNNDTDNKFLIASGGENLTYVLDDSSTFNALCEDLTYGKRVQFETLNNLLICCNGYDNNIKWDGKYNTGYDDGDRTENNLTAELGGIFCELNTGTDLTADKWYSYKIAYYDGDNYYYSTAVSNAIKTGSTVHNIRLTGIPLGETGITTRYIYRTTGQSAKSALSTATYYLVDTISDNYTTTYDDSKSDATISVDNVPKWNIVSAGSNITPPVCKYCILHENRLFLSGNLDNKSTIYWSEIENPNYFLPISNLAYRQNDGDEITFIKPLRNVLIIGKQNSITGFYTDGNPTTEWYLGNVITTKGCFAPYTAINAIVRGINVIVYMNRDGLYAFSGGTSFLMSDKIVDVIDDMYKIDTDNLVAEYCNNKIYISYLSVLSGDNINNRMLVYEVQRKAYSIDTDNIYSFCVFNVNGDNGTLCLGSSNADGNVWFSSQDESKLIVKYKSDISDGTFDDTAVLGDELNPILKIARIVWSDSVNTWATITGTWYAKDTDGNWISKTYEINADDFNNLYWNEKLNNGDVTIQINTSDSTPVSTTFTGTEYSNPNGSDISSETARKYIRFKVNFTSNSIYYEQPYCYSIDGFVIKIGYNHLGTTKEAEFVSVWQSGFLNLLPQTEGLDKVLTGFKIYYRGDTGLLKFYYKNIEGTCNQYIPIDLTINPLDDINDRYYGVDGYKIYYVRFPHNTGTEETPRGDKWSFKIVDEDNAENWVVDRIIINYTTENKIW